MELLQLKYFYKTAKNGSITATAKEFGVPASSVSQSIKRLEKELNINFFVRKANSVSLSEKGAVFLQYAENALDNLSNGVAAVSDDINSGEINICINTNRRIVMDTVEKFKNKFPNVSIKTWLSSDYFATDFDLIIDKSGLTIKNYVGEKLLEEQLAVAISKNSPLSQNFNITKLSNAPFIAMNEHTSLYETTISVCKKFGFTPKIAIQSDDPFYVRKCVELNLGVAVVPLFSWQGQFNDSIVLKPIKNCTRSTFLYVNNKKHLPYCIKDFVKLLKENCRGNE